MDEEVERAVRGIIDVSVPAVGAEVSEEDYVCQICGISFSRKFNFKRHMRVHEDNDGPKCQICEMIFTRKDNLTAHMKTAHSQSDMTMEDNIICDECGKQCKSKKALSDHTRIHSKRHVCDSCNARFSHKNKLKRHMASHSQQKQQCQKCCRYFIQLKEHMERCTRTNDERKPAFECTSCKKSFKEKRYLNQHNKNVHNNNTFYECQHCRLNFRHRSSRLLHLRKEHPK